MNSERMGDIVCIPMPSDPTRLHELRERVSQCIALAEVSAASGADSRAMQQVLALLSAVVESLDHHHESSGSGSNREAP